MTSSRIMMLNRAVIITMACMIIGLIFPSIFLIPAYAQYQVGDTVCDFTLYDSEGNSVSLSDFDGKVILLFFFETGCPYCTVEAQSIERNIWQVFGSRGLQVLAINLGESSGKIKGWAAELNLTYPILIDRTTSVWGRYSMGAFPQNVVLDTSRVVRYTNTGYEESIVKSTINQWLPKMTALSRGHAGAKPGVFQLFQNYPNPFNPSTTIGYNLPEMSAIDLILSDLSGREIRRLVCGPKTAGFHEVTWDGLDENGCRVAAGLYFYTLRSRDYEVTRQLLLVK